MTIRKILSIIFVITLIFSSVINLTSCESVKEYEEKESPVDGLVCLSRQGEFIENYGFNQYILYDPETFVMYSFISGGRGSAMSVLYNADGTLKRYTPVKIETGE